MNRSTSSQRNWLPLCVVGLLVAMGWLSGQALANPMLQSRNRNAKPFHVFISTIRTARRHVVAAAVARSTSIFVMYPIDTIKTRLQMHQANPFRLAGIFSGVVGSLSGQVPYGVLTFGSYEVYKQTMLDRLPNIKPIFIYALAAVMGDLTGSGVLCPSEVVKQKMQAGMYLSTQRAVVSIWSNKGVLGFYEGYFGGLVRDIPFRVAQLTTFEVTKNAYLLIKNRRKLRDASVRRGKRETMGHSLHLSPFEAAGCGAISGSFSAAVTAPLDRIKTLLMTDSAKYGGSVQACVAKILREEGVAGLYTGLVPRVTYIAPSVVLFFIAYELVQQRLKNW